MVPSTFSGASTLFAGILIPIASRHAMFHPTRVFSEWLQLAALGANLTRYAVTVADDRHTRISGFAESERAFSHECFIYYTG
jgi:hypothetical protein